MDPAREADSRCVARTSSSAGTSRLHLRQRSAPGVVLACSASDVQHAPPPPQHARETSNSQSAPAAGRPLYLCEAFAAGACAASAACPDVHVDIARTTRIRAHFRTLDAPGPRLGTPGQLVFVARPNQRQAVALTVDASECLETRVEWASAAAEAPPAILCGHFTRKRVCDYGAECRFVHALLEARPSPWPNMGAAVSSAPTAAPAVAGAPRDAALHTAAAGSGNAEASPRGRRARYWHNPYGAARGWSASSRGSDATAPPSSPTSAAVTTTITQNDPQLPPPDGPTAQGMSNAFQ